MQSALAIALMGGLVAVVIPRMSELVEDARSAKVQALGSAFKAAVFLTRESWYAAGKPEGALANFGDGQVIMSPDGWPLAVQSSQASPLVPLADSRQCKALWQALLVKAAPEAMVAGEPFRVAEFLAEMEAGVCRFHYLEGDIDRFIEYEPASGRVIWQVR